MADALVIVGPNSDVVLIDQPSVVILQTNGGSGPAGPPGPPGGAAFLYVQASPSASWIINHGLGSFVHVTVMNTSGVIVEGEITEVSLNTVNVSFSQPQAGKALVSP